MKKLSLFMAVAVLGWTVSAVQAAEKAAEKDGSQLIIEAADAVTLGDFTYQDTKINESQEWFNPHGSAELRFGGTPIAIGGEFAQSENTFDGTYDGSDGKMDVDRKEYVAFVRLGHKNGCNLRLGYRNFNYDIDKALIHQDNGETDINGKATGDLTTGIDAELNLAAGDAVQFALGLGGTYFIDAKYKWSYEAIGGPNPGFHAGTATVNAYSARIRPELSFAVTDDLRIFVNYMISASTWETKPDNGQDYVGIDIYSAASAGIRYTFGL